MSFDERCPSETPTVESNNSQKGSGGWKRFKDKMKTYTKQKSSPAQTNTGTTATKTPNTSSFSHEEETKKDEEELNVQIIEDNEQFNRHNYDNNSRLFRSKTLPSEESEETEEEHEDVQSFVAETDGGSKSKKSSGDS